MQRLLQILAAAIVLVSGSAYAADPNPPVLKAPRSILYPYSGSGFYFGVGSVAIATNPNINGVTQTNLQAVGASLGVKLGYRWALGTPASDLAMAIETANYWNNVGAATTCDGTSCSVSSRFTSIERVKLIAPLSMIASLFPGLNLPSLPTLPAGINPVGNHTYAFVGAKIDDTSAGYGYATGRQWQASPGLGVGFELQIANGSAVDVWAGYFSAAQGFNLGPATALANQGHTWMTGVSWDF